ncbi:MAG: hypothetical protein JXA68_12120, partial [Ignavibacteriales bacterium]|nr:hypothetical protein [Ignavibacteriales bacterium]
MAIKKYLILLLFVSVNLCSQTFIGNLNPFPSTEKLQLANDTLKILAVMVEFQEDKYDATYGNGKFGSIYTGENKTRKDILDPLPHNTEYFSNHLEFAKNYFKKVSNNNLNLGFYILPQVITVSKEMREYSPAVNSNDFSAMGNFCQEVWTTIDTSTNFIDFNQYDLFVIFHAGVGRELNTPGSLGNDKDLPSVYLGSKAFKEIYGQQFAGFPVEGGSFQITNTIILPETESREVETFNGNYLIELTINGLIVASIASHLGLPDLYDTESGLSRIGRFGLMDGQSIFAYMGLFPPEPSAWEKIYLGWEIPTTISVGEHNVNLVNYLIAQGGDTTLLKIPINSSEYFLVENRKRDALKNGSILNYIVDDLQYTKTFKRDTTGYLYYDVDSISGVVIDVDEFDWALPGYELEDKIGDPFDDIGLLIWHIDENIIQSKIENNEINNDKNNLGVRLIEADGIFEIGEEFYTLIGDRVVGEGTKEDTWYSSNPAEFYENEFGLNTKPNTNSNNGSKSLITINNFSEINNTMSFDVKFGYENFELLKSTHFNLLNNNSELSYLHIQTNDQKLYLLNNKNLYRLNIDGQIQKTINDFSNLRPAVSSHNTVNLILGVVENKLNILHTEGLLDTCITFLFSDSITANPVFRNFDQDTIYFSLGISNGRLFNIGYNVIEKRIYISDSNQIILDQSINQILYNSYSLITYVSSDNHLWNTSGLLLNIPEKIIHSIATIDKNNQNVLVLLSEDNIFYVIQENYILETFKVLSNVPLTSFTLADIKKDGDNYIVLNNGKKIEAYNLNGALAENFPFYDPLKIGFTGLPLTTDVDDDSYLDIIATTIDGRIIVLNPQKGTEFSLSPIYSGAKISSTPI